MPGILSLTLACPVLNTVYLSGDVIGTNLEQIRFRSRINSCSGTITNTGCQIDISYNWTDQSFNSGTATATIAAGASQTIVTPSGEPISSFSFNSIAFNGGSCTGYSSSINAC
jgi:hypothetical protein